MLKTIFFVVPELFWKIQIPDIFFIILNFPVSENFSKFCIIEKAVIKDASTIFTQKKNSMKN